MLAAGQDDEFCMVGLASVNRPFSAVLFDCILPQLLPVHPFSEISGMSNCPDACSKNGAIEKPRAITGESYFCPLEHREYQIIASDRRDKKLQSIKHYPLNFCGHRRCRCRDDVCEPRRRIILQRALGEPSAPAPLSSSLEGSFRLHPALEESAKICLRNLLSTPTIIQ